MNNKYSPKSNTVQMPIDSIWTVLYKNRPDSLKFRGCRESTVQR